jgi:hypothetical protein
MKKKLLVFFAILSISAIAFPTICSAQAFGVGAGTGSQTAKPRLDLNREPVFTVNLRQDLVEILPGGGVRSASGGGGGMGGLQVGRTAKSGFGLNGLLIGVDAKLVQLDANGMVFEITLTDRNSSQVLLTKTLPLKNYEEGIVELATSTASEKRLAVRLIPTIQVKDPVLDYPALVKIFGASDSMWIKNYKELLLRGGGLSSIEDLNGKVLQFVSLQSPSTGLLMLSYRPFPGAIVAGYIQGKQLIFKWQGDVFECTSIDQPFLPEGKWAVYVWQADSTPAASFAAGALASDPDNLFKYVDRYRQQIKK